jgi:hypothetical protein
MTKFDIHVHTQDHENYNTDGVGPAYWKAKGGHTVVIIAGLAGRSGMCAEAEALVAAARASIEVDNDYYRSHVIDWEFVVAGELTGDEKLALEYEGVVRYPDKRLTPAIDFALPA